MPNKENYSEDLLCQEQDIHKFKCEITVELMMTGWICSFLLVLKQFLKLKHSFHLIKINTFPLENFPRSSECKLKEFWARHEAKISEGEK